MSSVETEELATDELMSIGELGRRVGASPSALRYWERSGLLGDVRRESGRRRYPVDAVGRVGLIRLCQDAGFGIGEIRTLLATDPLGGDDWKDMTRDKLAEVEAALARLQVAADMLRHTLACPQPSLSQCPSFTAFVRWRAEGGEMPAHQNPYP